MSSSDDHDSYPIPVSDDNNFKLSPPEIHQLILKYCLRRNFGNQTTLLTVGSPNRAIYYVESGYAYLYHYHDKKLFVPFLVGKGNWITDKKSFYASTGGIVNLSSENLVVAQGSVLQELSIENYHRLIGEQGDIELLIHKKRAAILEDMYSSLICLRDANAQKKVEWLLDAYHGILRSVAHNIVAAYLGMKEETFSRKLKELTERQIAERRTADDENSTAY